MKKKLSYRDKLIELAYIYNVKEIQDYTKRRKNLTPGQIELILKKNKIVFLRILKLVFLKKISLNQFQNLKQASLVTKKKKLKIKIDFLEELKTINTILQEK